MARLPLSLKRGAALTVTKFSIGKNKLVYLLICDKKLQYPCGRSRIAYVGTTRKGLSRISQSVAARAEDILSLHGVQEFHARVVTCKPRQNVKTWHKLERAFLLTFKDIYGEVPVCNSQGHRMKVTDEFEYFSMPRVKRIIDDVS